MTEIRAVVFDLDGTLLDHTAAATTSVREWLGNAGLAADAIEPLIPIWFALEDKHYEAYRAGEASLAEQRRRRMREFLPLVGRGVEEDALDTTFAGYLARYEANWIGFPDAAGAVRTVRDLGVRTAVLTNGDQDQQTRKLTSSRPAGRDCSASTWIARPATSSLSGIGSRPWTSCRRRSQH